MIISWALISCLALMGAGYGGYIAYIHSISNDILSKKLKYRDFVGLLFLIPLLIFWSGMLTAEGLLTLFIDNGVILTDYEQASSLVFGFVNGLITVPAVSFLTIIIQAIFRKLKRRAEPVDEWEQALKEGRRIK